MRNSIKNQSTRRIFLIKLAGFFCGCSLSGGLKKLPFQQDIASAKISVSQQNLIELKEWGAKGNANFYNTNDGKYYEDENFTIEASDDTLAIQKAIDSINNDYPVIIDLAGNYLISRALKVAGKNNITIEGGSIIPFNFENKLGTSLHESAFCLQIKNSSNITVQNVYFHFGDSSGQCSAILMRNCSDSTMANCKIESTNDSKLSSGIVVASQSQKILIYKNNLSGGYRAVYSPNWEKYRGFAISVCGDDISITNNQCSGWALGAIKAGANYFVLTEGEEIMSYRNLIQNNIMFDNSQQDIGATGICDTLTIRGNLCNSKPYEPAQRRWKICNSIHLKSGYGARGKRTNRPGHRLINVVVHENICSSNIAVRSVTEIEESSVSEGSGNWIKNVIISNNKVTGGNPGSEYREQGITVRAAEDVTISNNLIVDTLSYAIAVAGARIVNITGNTIKNSRRLAAYILLHDLNTYDQSGRCYNISIKDNIFSSSSAEGAAQDTVKFVSSYGKVHESIYLSGNIDQKDTGFTHTEFPGNNLVNLQSNQ